MALKRPLHFPNRTTRLKPIDHSFLTTELGSTANTDDDLNFQLFWKVGRDGQVGAQTTRQVAETVTYALDISVVTKRKKREFGYFTAPANVHAPAKRSASNRFGCIVIAATTNRLCFTRAHGPRRL